MFEAVLAGATAPEIEGVEVVRRPALTVSPVEMLEADGYLLGTPANLGYISGALKHNSGEYPLIETLVSEGAGLTSCGLRLPAASSKGAPTRNV